MAPYEKTRISSPQNLTSVNTALQLRSIVDAAAAGRKVVACLDLNMVLGYRTLLTVDSKQPCCLIVHWKMQTAHYFHLHPQQKDMMASAARHRPSITQLEMSYQAMSCH